MNVVRAVVTLWLAAFCAAAPAHAFAQTVRELPDFTRLVDDQGNAVVNISTTQAVRRSGAAPQVPGIEDEEVLEFFRRFIPRQQPGPGPRQPEARSLGSGFIISADGYILTNAHVVEGADEINVRFTDKREFKAKVIGADRRTDIAVIKIEAAALPAVKFGDPAKLKVGEWVVAIGSPFGFENTVTAGIVSAKGRSLPQENFVPFIQTDVAINPGNSGGPLFNMRGEVVGINSQIYSRTGGFMGLSFAIPIDVALDIQKQLREKGRVARGRIGVVIQEVTRDLATSFGLDKPRGALVNSVEKGGPADKAGVEAGDVILRFDGKTVASSEDLPRIVGATRPGSKVTMQIWRNKGTRDVQVVVAEMQDERAARQSRRGGKPPSTMPSQFGLTLSDLSDAQKSELKVSGGVLVENVQGAGQRAGVRRGDVILAINNQDVKSVEQFNQMMAQFDKGRIVELLVRRGANSLYIPFRVDAG